MNEVGDTLERMSAVQLVAVLLFVTGYLLALGHLATDRGRAWAALLALVSAVVFVAFTRPWEHGVILVALASGVVGVFVALAWASNRYFERRQAAALLRAADAADSGFSDPPPANAASATSRRRRSVPGPASSH